MVKDIVCGMDIVEKDSIKVLHGGKEYYFCSESCKNQFLKNPGKYLEKQDKSQKAHGCC